MVLRYFLWVIPELIGGWDNQIELAGSLVGGGSEVDEVFKSASHSFCELDDTVYGLNGCGGHVSVEVGQDSIPMLANGLGQSAKGVETTTRRPTTPPPKFSLGNVAFGAGVDR